MVHFPLPAAQLWAALVCKLAPIPKDKGWEIVEREAGLCRWAGGSFNK